MSDPLLAQAIRQQQQKLQRQKDAVKTTEAMLTRLQQIELLEQQKPTK